MDVVNLQGTRGEPRNLEFYKNCPRDDPDARGSQTTLYGGPRGLCELDS